jgi:outer membrane lipoprotein-sorting protein
MMRIIILNICLLLIIPAVLFSQAPSAEEIIRKVEDNRNLSSEATGKIIISDQFGKRTKVFKSYQAENDDMMIEFLNPEEAGQKILRLKDEIYLYFPGAEDIIHLKGDSLKDSVFGSDFSYEDLTKGEGILGKYDAQLSKSVEETIDGIVCYKVSLTAKPKKEVVYPKQDLWVAKDKYVIIKGEFYALSGRLLKIMTTTDVRLVSGKYIAFRTDMKDAMKKDSSTVFQIDTLKLGGKIDPKLFSLEELSW